jgi:TnpA family transposase
VFQFPTTKTTTFRIDELNVALHGRRLGTTPRQGTLSLAMREIGRIERTVHTLDWIEDKGLRADTTALESG